MPAKSEVAELREQKVEPPSKILLATEVGRAFIELGLYLVGRPRAAMDNAGDGHPVLILPGFLASDFSTIPLRNFLNDLGYKAYPWGIGRNLADLEALEKMTIRLRELHETYQKKVSLIGWSLGGVMAREVARAHPGLVRLVITMGSPFAGIKQQNNASWAYELVTGKTVGELDDDLIKDILKPPPVPTTAIYTKHDGVVPWQHCLEQETRQSENVEVPGSHFGLGHNPLVLRCVADRLAQGEGKWKKFNGWR